MVRTRVAASAEKAATLLILNRMVKTRSNMLQMVMALPNCSWKIEHAMLDTAARSNLIRMDAMDETWRMTINFTKPQGLQSVAGAPWRVVGYVRLVTKICQRVGETGSLVVKN